jgi:hypothetical protein
MRMPGFTAEAGIGASITHYSGAGAFASAAQGAGVHPALVAAQQCRTSPCRAVGRCKTRVRCCRNTFTHECTCSTLPCGAVA